VDARGHLRAAHGLFELLGAEPWAERARAELRAGGETARRRNPSSLDELTPQELNVLREIAAGATYRQAAQNLFLSPKTIEYHLHKIYRKLDVQSRQELVARLETLNGAPPPGAVAR
jgi:DNA-binding CsgD family transcriptional regulator